MASPPITLSSDKDHYPIKTKKIFTTYGRPLPIFAISVRGFFHTAKIHLIFRLHNSLI